MGPVVDKKAKVMGKGGGQRRRVPLLVAVLVVVMLAGVVLVDRGTPGSSSKGGSYNLGSRKYDPGRRIQQTEIVPDFRDGRIYVDLARVNERGIVSFKIPNQPVTLPNGTTFDYLPVTVYVAPSGRVVAAVSFCEPCSGTTFHIRGNRLVCNVCGTEWNLEDLRGISGGCVNFPPDEVRYQVEGGNLLLDEQELRSWKPRV